MNRSDAFDQIVSDWLHADADHRVPEHLDAVLRRTRTERQRPAWSSLERWLPVQTTLRFAPAPRVAWLLIVVILIAALGAAALIVGSRARVPAPFGPARNGEVVFATAAGDIETVDPATNAIKALVAGSTNDRWPWFAADGATFMFWRETATTGQYDVMLANADGSNVRRLGGPFGQDDWVEPSPDGTKLAVIANPNDVSAAARIVDVATGTVTALALGGQPHSLDWRPDGRELVYLASHGGVYSLGAIHPDGSGLRPILPAGPTDATQEWLRADPGGTAPALSPDGTKIAYLRWDLSAQAEGVLHVVDVDTGVDQTPVFDGVTIADEHPVWSPDSTHLLFERYLLAPATYHLAVAPATGGHVVEIGPEMPRQTGGAQAQFSPDGTKIFATYISDNSTWLLDPAGGPETRLYAAADNGSSWQRLAP